MRKFFKQKLLLFLLLIVGTAIVLNSCQQDDVSIAEQTTRPEQKTISWEQFQTEVRTKTNANTILAQLKPTSLMNPNEKANFGGYEVDDSEIIRMQNGESTGYTMKIVDEDSQSFKNIFIYIKDGVVEYKELTYTPDESFANRKINDADTYFTGTINIAKEGESTKLGNSR